MKKIIITLSVLALTLLPCFASNNIESIIKKSPISKNATISISIRDLKSGNIIYENDANKLLNPASTLKAFTTPVIYSQLGDTYEFKTQMYKVGSTAYLKLSADPTITSRNARHVIRALRNANLKQPDKFYIDDSIMDSQDYGIGWQWDDDVSSYLPKYSSYNLDGNMYKVQVIPSNDKKTIKVITPESYKIAVTNNLKYGAKNNIFVKRNYWDGTEKIALYGTVNSPTDVKIPTFNQKRYFLKALQDIMDGANVRYYGVIESKKVPANAELIAEYKTPITNMYATIMKNSNNLYSETLFKIAGGKYKNSQGTTKNGIDAFNNYYKKIGVDTSDIVIVDASGVSRNDLLTTDWMTNALVKINQKDEKFNYKERFNVPNEGTMENRLFDLRDYLWAKTGTLANTSGLTGYIETKNGHNYAFAILIQNTKEDASKVKQLEDEIITTIFNKY